MKNKCLIPAGMVLLAISVAWGQGKGKGPQGARQQEQGQQQMGAQPGQGNMDRSRDRVRATDQQRDQVRSCDRTADLIRTQSRQLAKGARAAGFNLDQARKSRNQVQEQLSTMNREHERLVQGLDADQKLALQAHIRNMEQAKERVNTQLRALDQELDRPQPDQKEIAERAREMERTMKDWQKQYAAMESRMTVQP